MRLMVELAISKRENAEVLESIGDIFLAKTPMIGKSNDRRFSGRARVILGLLLMEGVEKVS